MDNHLTDVLTMYPDEVPIHERAETVPFFWPSDNQPPRELNVETYSVMVVDDKAAFYKVQASIGWDVTEDQWQVLSEDIVENSTVLVSWCGEPVAVACALSATN
jgi:hypothetical protein